jgi:hypothetical protein
MAKPLYVGVFLTPEARALLLLRIAPIHPEVHADHMTIKFKPTDLELENLVLGKAVRLKVTSSVHDEKGQAVNVHGVFSANKHSHITISVDRDKGGTPNYSNELLEKDETQGVVFTTVFPEELILNGTIDTYPRTEHGDHNNG